MCMRRCCADRSWVREFGTDGRDAFPGKGQLKPDAEELRSLKREVVKLKAERDILKKATVRCPTRECDAIPDRLLRQGCLPLIVC